STKTYRRDLQRLGGGAAVLADDLQRWFAGLWRGRSLAVTLAWITGFASLGLFLLARQIPSDLNTARGDDHDPGRGGQDRFPARVRQRHGPRVVARDLSPPRDHRAAVGRRLWLERQRDLRRRGWHVRRRDVQPLGPATARGATDMRVARRRLSQWPRA